MITFDDERGVGTVSITDYAQKSLGDVVFVELPEKGATIELGGELSFLPPPSPPQKTWVPHANSTRNLIM